MNEFLIEEKKNQIVEILSNYNINNFSIKKIKEELKNILGEEPALEIKWQEGERLNENKVYEKFDMSAEITVYFAVDSLDTNVPNISSLKYII